MNRVSEAIKNAKVKREYSYESACVNNDFIRYSNAFKNLTDEEIDIFLFLCAKAKESYQSDYELKSWNKELVVDIVDYYNKTH